MPTFDKLQVMIERVASYPRLEVVFELAVIWVVVYAAVRFVQGTRAAGALKGFLVVLLAATVLSRVLGGGQSFERLAFLFDKFLALVAVALVVIFQPELRRALVRLGETPFFRGTPPEIAFIVEQLAETCAYLAKARFGAIIVIERRVGLAGLVEGGTRLNAELSAELLKTIFYPNTALHDLAVVIKGKVVHSAGVQLPLAEPGEMPEPGLGSRHRAAVGLSKECDALVVVVSEESGRVRFAERGRLSEPMSAGDVGEALRARLTRGPKLRRVAGAKTAGEQAGEQAEGMMSPGDTLLGAEPPRVEPVRERNA